MFLQDTQDQCVIKTAIKCLIKGFIGVYNGFFQINEEFTRFFQRVSANDKRYFEFLKIFFVLNTSKTQT